MIPLLYRLSYTAILEEGFMAAPPGIVNWDRFSEAPVV
jgi:hypothetical protein